MNDTDRKFEKSKAIIISTCRMLDLARQGSPQFPHEFNGSAADFYVLLHDATKLFCQAVSQHWGETDNHRWSPALPELLLSHPERCDETLALVQRQDYHDVSYFQFAAV
jgi:hypothetical protein